MKKILLWLKIIRPQTLFASFCPIMVGLITVEVSSWFVAAITLLCGLSLQILANLINDYYDFKRGADKAGRAGYKRVLSEGIVNVSSMRKAIATTLFVVLVTGAYLIWCGGWPILLIGVTAILFAWLYTATRFSLAYLGIADIFVLIYFGMVAATGTAYLQTSTFELTTFYAGTVNGLISMCVLIINNLRDMEDDRLVQKKTFPVRFGKRAGEIGMFVIVLLMPLFSYLAFGWNWSQFIIVPALILYFFTRKAQGPTYNRCLLATGLLNLLYVLMVELGIRN
mgnify:CR=1 FL=1